MIRSFDDFVATNPDLFESEEEKAQCRDMWAALRFMDIFMAVTLLLSVGLGYVIATVGLLPVLVGGIGIGLASYMLWQFFVR